MRMLQSTHLVLLLITAITVLNMKCQAAKMVDVALRVEQTSSGNEELKTQQEGDLQFLEELLGFDKDQSLKEVERVDTSSSTATVKFQQVYKGYDVFDTIVTAQLDSSTGRYNRTINGTIITDIDQDIDKTELTLTEKGAGDVAKRVSGDLTDDIIVDNTDVKLVVYLDRTEKARICYIVSYFVYAVTLGEKSHRMSPARPYVIIDGVTSEVLSTWDGLRHAKLKGIGGNTKVGIRQYGKGSGMFKLEGRDGENGFCVLENEFVRVSDLRKMGISATKSTTVYCKDDPLAEGGMDGASNAANDALYYGTKVSQMYQEWYGISAAEQPITLRVNYGKDFPGAFWDGQGATFGSGNAEYFPFVSLDLVSHEIAHGFTERHSGLLNIQQSAVIAEAFSDIAGEAAEFYAHGSNDWRFGYDVVKNGDAIRYFDDPTRDGRSIDNVKDYNPRMKTHYASGIFNKAFHLLASSDGWGVRKAFDVFLLANRVYWRPQSDFVEAACGVERAAADLRYRVSDVQFAFYQVGLDTCSDFTGFRQLHDGEVVEVSSAADGGVLKLVLDPPVFSSSFQCSLGSTNEGRVKLYGRNRLVPKELENFHDLYKELDIKNSSVRGQILETSPYYLILKLVMDTPIFYMTCDFIKMTELTANTELTDLKTLTRPLYFNIKTTEEDTGKLMSITTTGLHGDADIVASFEKYPTLTRAEYHSTHFHSMEAIDIPDVKEGSYYVMVYPSRGFFELSLKVKTEAGESFVSAGPSLMEIKDIQPVSTLKNLTVRQKHLKLYYKLLIPKRTKSLDLFLSEGKGDPDIYLKHGIVPTMTDYEYRPWVLGSYEMIMVPYPESGVWYIMIDGWTEFSGVQLDVRCVPMKNEHNFYQSVKGRAKRDSADGEENDYEQRLETVEARSSRAGPFNTEFDDPMTLEKYRFGENKREIRERPWDF